MKKLLILMILFPLVAFGQTRPHYTQIAGAPLTDARAFGAKGDGVTDDTAALQAAVSAGNTFIPSGEYAVSIPGTGQTGIIDIPSNRVVVFAPGVTIRLLPHNRVGYQILRIHQADNVHVVGNGVILDGFKSGNSSTTGEWGMGVSIRSSTNVTIEGVNVVNTWGDGVYIGREPTNTGVIPENIRISGVTIDGSRRQGVSMISGRNVFLRDFVIKNILETGPGAGIDFEPNEAGEVEPELWNILVENFIIENTRHGVDLVCRNVPRTRIIMRNILVKDVTTDGFTNTLGSIASILSGYEDAGVFVYDFQVKGAGRAGINLGRRRSPGVPLVFHSPIIRDVNLDGWQDKPDAEIDPDGDLEPGQIDFLRQSRSAAITLAKEHRLDVDNSDVGNVHIYNPTVDSASATRVFYVRGGGNGFAPRLSKISFVDPILVNVPNEPNDEYSFLNQAIRVPGKNLRFSNKTLAYPLPDEIEISGTVSAHQVEWVGQIIENAAMYGDDWGFTGVRTTGNVNNIPTNDTRLTLKFPDDSLLTRQLLVSNSDASWMTLTSDTPVQIQRSRLSQSVTGGPLSGIAFYRSNPPVINATFTFDTSTSQNPGNTYLMFLNTCHGTILRGNLESNDGRALYILGGTTDMRGVVASGTTHDITVTGGAIVNGAGSVGTVSGATVNVPSSFGLFLR